MERAVSVFQRNIAITAEMGAKHICIPFLLNIPGQSHEEAVRQLVGFFERVLPYAEEYGIPIAHEAPREHTPELALKIRQTLASDYYTICLSCSPSTSGGRSPTSQSRS